MTNKYNKESETEKVVPGVNESVSPRHLEKTL